MKLCTILPSAAALLALSGAAVSAQTLEEVRERGYLNCGVSPGVAGFSNPDDAGNWSGFDVEVCRAVAAAVLEDPNCVNLPNHFTNRRPLLSPTLLPSANTITLFVGISAKIR